MELKQFLVTVKLPKNPAHDPTNKVTGKCPASPELNAQCTDVTGQHHTFLWASVDIEQARLYWQNVHHYHVTRVEEVKTYGPPGQV